MSATETLYLGVTNTLQGGANVMSDFELATSSIRKLVTETQKRPNTSF
jgi:hypothetical protein